MANEFNIKNGFISRGDGTINGTLTVTTISATTYSNLPPSGISGSGSTGQITFFNSSSSLSGSSQLNWDDTNRVLRILGNGGSGTASYLQITNGASGITPGDGMLIGYGTDNNARISLQDANSLILSNSSGDALVLNTGNVSSVNNHIIGGPISSLNTGTRFQIESPGSGSSDYPFRVNGLASSKIHFMNGVGQVGIYKSTTTLGAMLDISVSGSLSTDVAFRVRDSVDSADIFTINGNGVFYKPHNSPNDDNPLDVFVSQMSDGRNKIRMFTKGSYNVSNGIGISFQSDAGGGNISSYTLAGAYLNANTSYRDNGGLSEFHVGGSDITQYSYLKLRNYGNTTTNIYIPRTGTIVLNPDNVNAAVRGLEIFGGTLGTTADRVISIGNGTAPTSSTTDNFQFWSADRGGVAGKASAHFRSEDGTVNVIGDLSGFGTSTPTERLEVSGKTKTISLQVTSGATNNYVLTSDASGNATWQPATITTLSSTTATIHFTGNTVFGTYSSPISSNLTDTLTNAKLGVVQKIYHNSGTAPTVPAGWVLLGSTTYQTSTLNIIYAEWSEGSRVEYWIVR